MGVGKNIAFRNLIVYHYLDYAKKANRYHGIVATTSSTTPIPTPAATHSVLKGTTGTRIILNLFHDYIMKRSPFLASPVEKQINITCEKGYVTELGLTSCYRLVHNQTATWSSAREICREGMGADLVIIESKKEMVCHSVIM